MALKLEVKNQRTNMIHGINPTWDKVIFDTFTTTGSNVIWVLAVPFWASDFLQSVEFMSKMKKMFKELDVDEIVFSCSAWKDGEVHPEIDRMLESLVEFASYTKIKIQGLWAMNVRLRFRRTLFHTLTSLNFTNIEYLHMSNTHLHVDDIRLLLSALCRRTNLRMRVRMDFNEEVAMWVDRCKETITEAGGLVTNLPVSLAYARFVFIVDKAELRRTPDGRSRAFLKRVASTKTERQ
jgi:hypothetical protein